MSEHQKYVLHLENKVKQLEYLLDQERVKCFGLKRILIEARFQLTPILGKLDSIRRGG
jgi:hypothetical protein